MALILMEQANLGLIHCKWGGVFGKELQVTTSTSAVPDLALTGLTTNKGEWKHSMSGDLLQEVREANDTIMQKIYSSKAGPETVTLLSGFLVSGKTALLSHNFSNYSGIKVAILANITWEKSTSMRHW